MYTQFQRKTKPEQMYPFSLWTSNESFLRRAFFIFILLMEFQTKIKLLELISRKSVKVLNVSITRIFLCTLALQESSLSGWFLPDTYIPMSIQLLLYIKVIWNVSIIGITLSFILFQITMWKWYWIWILRCLCKFITLNNLKYFS